MCDEKKNKNWLYKWKGSGIINEDDFLIENNIFGVFDGATGLVKYFDENGNSGGADSGSN